MTEEERQRERDQILARLDNMVRQIGAASVRMESAGSSFARLAESLDRMAETCEALDERLDRIEQFFAWLSAQIGPEPRGKKNGEGGSLSKFIEFWKKNS